MKARFAVIALVAVFVLAMPVHAQLCRDIQGGLSNFDVRNSTGYTANDFEVILMGVTPSDLASFYMGSYPNVSVSPVAGGVKVTWTGDTTANGDFAHFGIGIDPFLVGGVRTINPTSTEFSWTFNGNPRPNPPPRTWQNWQIVSGFGRDVIRNQGISNIWVQRRFVTMPGLIALEDLMRGGAIWNAGVGIDTSRVQIGAGLDLNYDFEITSNINYVMMYDVFDSEFGDRSMTFLNSVTICPEPSSMIALVAGLGSLLVLRRRKA